MAAKESDNQICYVSRKEIDYMKESIKNLRDTQITMSCASRSQAEKLDIKSTEIGVYSLVVKEYTEKYRSVNDQLLEMKTMLSEIIKNQKDTICSSCGVQRSSPPEMKEAQNSKSSSDEICRLEKCIEKMENEHIKYQGEITALKSKNDILQSKMTDVVKTKNDILQQNTALENENAILQTNVTKSKQFMDTKSEKQKNELIQLRDHNKYLEDEISRLKRCIEKMENEHIKYQGEITTLKTKIDTHQSSCNQDESHKEEFRYRDCRGRGRRGRKTPFKPFSWRHANMNHSDESDNAANTQPDSGAQKEDESN